MDGKIDQVRILVDGKEAPLVDERFATLKLVAEKAIIRDQIRRWMIADFKLRGIRIG